MAVTYLILRIQGSLPLNPQHLGAVTPALSFNTAVSFLTNTNWQNYGGETTMSYFSQIGALTVQQFVSPAVGIAVAIAMVRGFSRRNSATIGNFWVDITRCMLYILLPIAFIAGIIFVGQGAVQTLAGPATVHNALNGVTQTIARGPIGFMEAIKQLGHQRRRLLQRQLGHHLREPDRPHQLAVDLPAAVDPLRPDLHLRQDGGQHPPRGRPAGRHGHHLRRLGRLHQPTPSTQRNPAVAAAGVHRPAHRQHGGQGGPLRGHPSRPVRRVLDHHLTGSADASYDSFTPMGGFGLLTGMMLGEVTPGGTGSGLYTILLYAIIAVFIGGLMIGRTPEYLGKKIQAREVKLAGLGRPGHADHGAGGDRHRGVDPRRAEPAR